MIATGIVGLWVFKEPGNNTQAELATENVVPSLPEGGDENTTSAVIPPHDHLVLTGVFYRADAPALSRGVIAQRSNDTWHTREFKPGEPVTDNWHLYLLAPDSAQIRHSTGRLETLALSQLDPADDEAPVLVLNLPVDEFEPLMRDLISALEGLAPQHSEAGFSPAQLGLPANQLPLLSLHTQDTITAINGVNINTLSDSSVGGSAIAGGRIELQLLRGNSTAVVVLEAGY